MFRSTRRAARVSSMHSLRHRLFVERLEDRTTPSTFTVVNTNDTTDTNDPGYVGSLRWAIGQANADADPLSTINFNIAAPGVQTISVASALPMIEHSVVINGYSQPGTSANTHHMDEPNPGNDPNYRSDNANLLIRIDGTLSITGGGSTVEGLIVRNIRISGGGGNTIAGDFIGTDGDLVLVGGGIGVSINGASNNTIGGTTPDSRNLIVARDTSTDLGPSSDLGAGIRTLSSSGNIIQGNFIGLDRTGKNVITAPGSWSYGIFVNGFLGGSDNNTIGGTTPEERNVISGWGLNQIVMSFSQGHKVQGNYIGTDAYGHAPNLPPRNPALYPASYGPYYGNVGIFDATGANNFIGGTTSGAGNLVGGQQFGIYVNNDGVNVVATGIDVVQGNVVGIGPTGLGLPNGEGIGGAGSLIGGTKDGAKNIVAGNNGSGIGASGGMLIEGNDVHDNGGAGVQVGGTGVTIQDNSIHANAGPGVWLTADPFGPANPFGYESSGYADATEVRIERNFIYANVGLGIALGDIAVDASGNPLTLDQVIANFDSNPDLWDHDIPNNTVVLNDSRGHVGPNNWQNFPVIAATRAGTTTYVQGSLHSTANATFTLDFYANSVADPSGYGQGQRWLGSADITTDGSGNVTFDSDQFSALLGASSLGEWITATATDANGNTSEFSPAFKLNDLAIYGTAGADAISLSGAGGGAVQIVDNGVSHTYTVPGQIFVFGQGGGDTYTVNFGSNLATPITLVGSGDASGDVLVVNGDNSSTNVITKTTDQLTWGSPVTETVYRSGIPNTTINANGTSNNYVNDPGGNTVINGGPGANTIVVTASSGTGIVINGGSSTNTYIVDLGSLAGPITINNSNTTASDNLVVNGAAGDNTITASGSQVTAGTQTINVAAPLTSATINGGSGSNQITVSNLTVAVQSLTLDGGGGNNTITLVNASADIGSLAINGGSNTGTNQVQVQGSVPATVSVQNITPVATILDGFLFEDFNDDGQIDFGENGISGITVRLRGTNDLNQTIDLSATTDSAGLYDFHGVRPGAYTISANQPSGYTQGILTVGSAGGSVAGGQFHVQVGSLDGMNYNFGERPVSGSGVQHGQTAGIGFWNNKNGQALIKSLNGGANATQIGNWLAATFVNFFGANAGSNNLCGLTNSQVAAAFQQKFVAKGQKLDAQVMATALAVYVTNETLAGTVAATYGFTVTHDGVGIATFNVGNDGAAVGRANGTTMSILDILLAADSLSTNSNGNLYGGNTTKRNAANDLYSAINQTGGI